MSKHEKLNSAILDVLRKRSFSIHFDAQSMTEKIPCQLRPPLPGGAQRLPKGTAAPHIFGLPYALYMPGSAQLLPIMSPDSFILCYRADLSRDKPELRWRIVGKPRSIA